MKSKNAISYLNLDCYITVYQQLSHLFNIAPSTQSCNQLKFSLTIVCNLS